MKLNKHKVVFLAITSLIVFVFGTGFSSDTTSPGSVVTLEIALQDGVNLNNYFGVLELPFLLIAVYFAFRTARALKGGVFGRGMSLIAVGALVMAIGHLHMQVLAFFDFNLFDEILGNVFGSIVWIIALIVTWGLTGAGFYSIYKASRAD
jgi:uncharacterized membrane protein YGL010W